MRPLRLAFIGGGPGAGIAPVHRAAARLDGDWDLVAGAFSRDAARNTAAGEAAGIDPDRCYPSVAALLERETSRPDPVDCVAILGPNDLHAPAAIACLEAGVNVLSEKPMALDLSEATRIADAARRGRALYRLVHNYSAYPMVHEAARHVAAGELGRLLQIVGEFGNGSRTVRDAAEREGGSWWMDPARGGPSIILSNLGTHLLHLLGRVCGDSVASVSARLSAVTPERQVHDTAVLNLALANGAQALLWLSMSAPGNGHGLRLRLFGEAGGLDWTAEHGDRLELRPREGPMLTLRRGEPWLGPAARRATRTRPGQTEGFIEAMANIYRDLAEQIRARRDGRAPAAHAIAPATPDEGLAVMRVLDAALHSHAAGGAIVAVSPAAEPLPADDVPTPPRPGRSP